MTEPRVLLLTSSFPQRPADPTADFVRRYAESIDLPGTVLTPEGSAPAESWQLGRMTVEYVPYWLPRTAQRVVHGFGITENLRRHPWARAQLPALLAAWTRAALRAAAHHDVIVGHWALPTGPVGVAAAQASGLPLVSVLHSGGVHALRGLPGGRLIARSILRTSDAIVASSAFVRDRFAALVGGTDSLTAQTCAHVLPMGFGHDESPKGASRQNAKEQHTKQQHTVLFLGRVNPIKGLDVLIDACAEIPNTTLHVAGYGPSLDACKAQASRLGLRAVFHGQVDDAKKWALLDQVDLLVVPSRVLAGGTTEGLPVALLEAMGRGTPVVATAVGGIPEVIRDPLEGLLVPPDDASALRTAIEAALSDPSGSQGRARRGQERAREYDWSAVGPQHRRVIVDAHLLIRPSR